MTTRPDHGSVVAAVWEEMVETTPDPFRDDWLLEMFGGPKRSYRERLDAPGINHRGAVIQRIWRVRHNLRQLGNIRLDPRRIP